MKKNISIWKVLCEFWHPFHKIIILIDFTPNTVIPRMGIKY